MVSLMSMSHLLILSCCEFPPQLLMNFITYWSTKNFSWVERRNMLFLMLQNLFMLMLLSRSVLRLRFFQRLNLMPFPKLLMLHTPTTILLRIIEATIMATTVAIIVATIAISTSNFWDASYNPSHSLGGSYRQYSGGRVPCQIYHFHDHEAIDCFKRMNHAFAGKIPPAKLAAMCAHTIAKSSFPTWILDSGTTSHITNDISAIHSPMPCHVKTRFISVMVKVYPFTTLVLLFLKFQLWHLSWTMFFMFLIWSLIFFLHINF